MKNYTLGKSIKEVEKLIPEGKIKKILLGSKELGVVRKGSEFHVFSLQCPHRGASLVNGVINQKNEIICPLHQYRFDLRTGKTTAGYCPDLDIYPTKLSDTGLEITLP